jgi:nucleotide-binding universal stress UspA family protein
LIVYTRILVPVDGSPTSLLGLKHAIGLAADEHAQLRLLNVVDESILISAVYAYPIGDTGDLIDSLRVSGRKALTAAAAGAAKRGVDVERAQFESHLHPVSDAILADARKWRADLIVMGTHGRRGLNRLILGSDAERVVREAPVPVLLVRGAEARIKRKSTTKVSRRRGRAPRALRSARAPT